MALLRVLPSHAARCDADDYTLKVSGIDQCLVMRRFGNTEPDVMLVWLHGDVSTSFGPARYHFANAEKAAEVFSAAKTLSVALVRPGYPDGSGNTSTVSPSHTGRTDHYTRENVTEVGMAIERLRARFKPRTVIAIGHSGGAATTALILGLKPGLIDGAVLVSCPCDLATWRGARSDRKPWPRSEDPIKWAAEVAPTTRVIALSGDRDENTTPELSRTYVDALKARNVNAVFTVLPGETHNGAFNAAEVFNAVQELIAGR